MLEDGVAAYQRGDYTTALIFLRPQAEQGDVNAQYGLALMYFNGEGVPQDFTEAEKWWLLAAEQGHAEAQADLAYMYENGLGVQDNNEAVKWYRKAAEQGNREARYNLGLMYYIGEDIVQAHVWLGIAAALGDENAQIALDKAASEMTPDQIAEAQRMAREWMEKHQQ